MTDLFESESFLLPSQVKNDVAGRLKDSRPIRSLEFQVTGDALEGAKEFGAMLLGLKKRGVKISHEVLIKLDFPNTITREKTLAIVGGLPRPRNGSLRVRVHMKEQSPE
ncbi:MAG: hypothetical protein HYZ52_00770 [Candidatus Omnitrophica bacterium]|nr:hypothetical protein [Candidatus Omnitrophota bacterium]